MAEAKKPLIAIIGAGAVGSTLAVLLARANFPVIAFKRAGYVKHELQLILAGGDVQRFIPQEQSADLARAQVVLFCVKAYDLHFALSYWLPKIPQNCVVVSLTNGYTLPILAEVAKQHPLYQWRVGTVTLAVKEIAVNAYASVNHDGFVGWGNFLSPQTASYNEQLIFNCCSQKKFRWFADAKFEVRKKWLFNTVINTLCLGLNLTTNGQLLFHAPTVELMTEEVYAAGEELWGVWDWTLEKFKQEIFSIIHLTAENENSMVRDKRLGRPLETPFLSGQINEPKKYKTIWRYHSQM